MICYYNEIDPTASQWMRNLAAAGHISQGQFDERSIADVSADDVRNATRAHFFSGIGGWDHALNLAGWPADRPVWTGSCPCQPFSVAGKKKGEKDSRDLWPEFFRLITGCRPPVVFGEQVASSDVVGKVGHKPGSDGPRVWLDRIRADLEEAGYTFGACVLGAHSVGSPHIRQRLYWVAHTGGVGRERWASFSGSGRGSGERGEAVGDIRDGSIVSGLADAKEFGFTQRAPDAGGGSSGIRPQGTGSGPANDVCVGVALGNTKFPRLEGHAGHGYYEHKSERVHSLSDRSAPSPSGTSGITDFWKSYDLLPCRDGKSRRVEPGTFPLAHGVPGRVAQLRGYGNAIVPQVAAAFIKAFLETERS